MRVLGIDPGLGGAFALVDGEGKFLGALDMPVLPAGKGKKILCAPSIATILDVYAPDIAWIERVGAMPGQGVTSSFTFGMGLGVVIGVLGAKEIPFEWVTPRQWKAHFRLDKNKTAARATASRLYPQHAELFGRTKDDGRAEATLIARFGALVGAMA